MRNVSRVVLLGVTILLMGCSEVEEVGERENENMRHVVVDWVDAIAWDGKTYYYDGEQSSEVTEEDIDQPLGEITFSVTRSEEADNPSYILKNGDATFLKEGTTIYSIKDKDSYIYAQGKVYKMVD